MRSATRRRPAGSASGCWSRCWAAWSCSQASACGNGVRTSRPFPIRSFTDPELLVGACRASLQHRQCRRGDPALAAVAVRLSLHAVRGQPGPAALHRRLHRAATWAGGLVARGVSMRLLVPGGLFAMAVVARGDGVRRRSDALRPVRRAADRGRRRPDARRRRRPPMSSSPSRRRRWSGPSARRAPPSASSVSRFGLALSSSLIYGMFRPLLRQRLQEAGATPGEQAQAIGILQSYVQAGDTDKFDARLVHEVDRERHVGLSRELPRDHAGHGHADRLDRPAVLCGFWRPRAGKARGARRLLGAPTGGSATLASRALLSDSHPHSA